MAKYPVNQDQMTLGASTIGDLYSNMAQNLMLRMIRRLKQRGVYDLQTNPYAWQLEKLNDMHMLNAENIKYIAQQSGIAEKMIRYLIQNEGLKVYEDTRAQLAEETGSNPPPVNSVQETLNSYVQQTFRDLGNYVNQTLLTTEMGQNAAMQVYQHMAEETTAEVVTGLKSAEDAMRDTAMRWVNQGIPSAFVDKGGHRWSVETYARTVVNSTAFRTFNEMRTAPAAEFGIDTFLMSQHQACRPACAPIQGHVVTKRHQGFDSGDKAVGYVDSLYNHGYGEPGGTLGVNCHHYLTPFVIGVNTMPDVKPINPDAAIKNGRIQAQQRALERGVRDSKYKLAAAQELHDAKLAEHYRNRIAAYQGALREHVGQYAFLHRDYSRERIANNDARILEEQARLRAASQKDK